jgi:uncharacterized protein (TIGR02118 family)
MAVSPNVAPATYVAPPRRESMLKLVYLLRRKPGLSLEEFQQHWLERHSWFGRSNPAVRRYVQYHALPNDPVREWLAQAADGPKKESYDGVAVAWWDDLPSLQAAMAGDDVAAALEDEKHFIDHDRSVAVLTQENVVVEPVGDAPVVLIECLRRRADIDRKTFSDLWLHHGHIGQEAHRRGLLQGYIQNHALAEDESRVGEIDDIGASDESWDGVVTAYFHSLAVAKELFTSPLASEESYEDEKKFIDHSHGLYLMARRHVIKDLVR